MESKEKVIHISKEVCDGSKLKITLKVIKPDNEKQASYEDIEKDVQDVLSSLVLSLVCEIGGNKLTD